MYIKGMSCRTIHYLKIGGGRDIKVCVTLNYKKYRIVRTVINVYLVDILWYNMCMFKPINCLMCEKIFVPTGPSNKYCGDKKDNNSCAKKRHLQKRRENRYGNAIKYNRTCKNCQTEFTTTHPDKVYCGSRQAKTGCSFLFRAGKEYKQDLSLPKICLGCQVSFYAKTPTRLYCGNREEKTGCAYKNELRWSQQKRAKFTPHQKEIQAKYKLNRKLLTKYGLVPEDYENKLIAQNYCCAICSKPAEESTFHRKLYIDHNHNTNEVRGLLCHGCNAGLGMFMESIDNLELAINYIKKWNN